MKSTMTRLAAVLAGAFAIALLAGPIVPPMRATGAAPNPVAARVCDQAAELKNGVPVLPAGATDVVVPGYVEEDRGPISALYPTLDTTTDALYPLPCEPSIGGTLPAQAYASPTPDEVQAES